MGRTKRQLFTVITDYAGGTYVAQARATSVRELCARIDDVLPFDAVVPRPRKKHLERAIGPEPSPLEGLKNAWAASGMIGRRLAVVTIVRTEG